MTDKKITIIDGPAPTDGEWREGWASVPLTDAGYVQISLPISSAPTELHLHLIRVARAGDVTCCRCDDPILVGEWIHAVTVTAADGAVTYQQATHLRHLRG